LIEKTEDITEKISVYDEQDFPQGPGKTAHFRSPVRDPSRLTGRTKVPIRALDLWLLVRRPSCAETDLGQSCSLEGYRVAVGTLRWILHHRIGEFANRRDFFIIPANAGVSG
jgi:hypothetical protein